MSAYRSASHAALAAGGLTAIASLTAYGLAPDQGSLYYIGLAACGVTGLGFAGRLGLGDDDTPLIPIYTRALHAAVVAERALLGAAAVAAVATVVMAVLAMATTPGEWDKLALLAVPGVLGWLVVMSVIARAAIDPLAERERQMFGELMPREEYND